MGKNTNKRGVTPPQQGRIVRANSSPAVVAAGAAPQVDKGGAPSLKVTGGQAPVDPKRSPRDSSTSAESRVRSGTDPIVSNKDVYRSKVQQNVAGGAAPKGNMGSPRGGEMRSDMQDDQFRKGNEYAKGGKVSAEEKHESKAERKRELKSGDNDNAYAKGGKITRNSPVGEKSVGGNGGIPGVASNIPLAQPDGTPSTGVTASGKMNMSYAGVSTPQTGALRTNPVKRAGKAPSFPRPPR